MSIPVEALPAREAPRRAIGVRLLGVPVPDTASARHSLCTVDPEFARVIPEADRALAASALRLPVVALEPGEWAGPAGPGDVQAVLVTGGLLSRTVSLAGRCTPELFGPGDVIAAAEISEDEDVAWAVHQPSCVMALGERFGIAARRWPELWGIVVRRGALRANRLASQLAAMQLSRVEDRVERVLWQLAERWGRVTPDGVVVPVMLTHEALGRLVAAKRPTVSLALTTLNERGTVVRRIDGSWLLVAR